MTHTRGRRRGTEPRKGEGESLRKGSRERPEVMEENKNPLRTRKAKSRKGRRCQKQLFTVSF